MIPRALDGYDSPKLELKEMGIALVKTFIPPNVEECVGVLLFIGTMTCALSVYNIRVLTLNLFVALLLSLGELFVIRSNRDLHTLPRLHWGKVGVFLPVIFAAIGPWFALNS